MLILILGDAPQMISMLSGSNHVCKPEAKANQGLGLMTQRIYQADGCNCYSIKSFCAATQKNTLQHQ